MAKVPRFVAVAVRVVVAAAAAVAAIVMATSHQTIDVFGLELQAKFQHTPSLVFFVVANAVACAYSLLVFLAPPSSIASRLVLIADVMVGMLLAGAVAAAGAMADVGKNGNSHAGWLPICDQVRVFCDHVMGALIAGFVAVVLYFLLLAYSIFTVTLQ